MCGPAVTAVLGSTIGSTVISMALTIGGQLLRRQAENKQRRHQARQLAINKERADKREAAWRVQTQKTYLQESWKRYTESREAMALKRVFYGEAGITGQGMYRLLRDAASRFALEQSIATANYENQMEASHAKSGDISMQYQMDKAATKGRSWLPDALQVAGAAYEVYEQNQ